MERSNLNKNKSIFKGRQFFPFIGWIEKHTSIPWLRKMMHIQSGSPLWMCKKCPNGNRSSVLHGHLHGHFTVTLSGHLHSANAGQLNGG